MACACSGKRRQPTAYSINAPTQTTPTPEPVETTLRLPSGEEKTFGSKLEAHAARLRLGGTFVTQ